MLKQLDNAKREADDLRELLAVTDPTKLRMRLQYIERDIRDLRDEMREKE